MSNIKPIITKGDVIRAMTDERLADKISYLERIENNCRAACPAGIDCHHDTSDMKCKEFLSYWIKQPAKED